MVISYFCNVNYVGFTTHKKRLISQLIDFYMTMMFILSIFIPYKIDRVLKLQKKVRYV